MSIEQPAQPAASPATQPSPAGFQQTPQVPGKGSLSPCTATAAYFLFAQGSSILSLHHDTLALDRRFEGHDSDVTIISADNVSEKGAGRLVVSYDTAQTGIVWDLFTGNEISRFASFELIRVAAWMRNGNVAFGNARGEVVLFEPSTSEHISSRTIFDPITALAPASDCQAHAIGYLNGSILIATLQPSFTILHTLSTSRGPSPIVSLAWHASSTKQKSDMLATQTVDGDLSLWSVSKNLGDAPRVIRSLRKSEARSGESRWLGWSKNGRIIQYCDGETWSWDVRTKHVTYDCIPTIQDVKGVTNYGPTATLFTLGPDYTVQQYDVGSATMTANVQHLPGASAPTEATPTNTNTNTNSNLTKSDDPAKPGLTLHNLNNHLLSNDKGKATSASPQSTSTEMMNRGRPDQLVSPSSARSRTNSASSETSSHRQRYRYKNWAQRSIYSGTSTSFSTGSPVNSAPDTSLYSGPSFRYGSLASAVARAHQGSSRLRNELLNSPEDEDFATDLFPYARSRLAELPYSAAPRPLDEANSSPDELRKQMLNVVFGWNGDIEDLIRDEIGRHSPGSPQAIILSRWLGHIDTELMMSMAPSINSSYMDWMLLALSQLGKQSGSNQIGRPFVQRLLACGDIHASVAVLLGMGDGNDAIEVYVSRNMYMEAILLTCLLMPTEWSRLSYLVRKWGEHVVQNSQQHLAIRCFSCTAADPTEPWGSPTVTMTSILSDQLSSQSSPPPVLATTAPQSESPKPLPVSSPLRPAERDQGLRLITSFGSKGHAPFKFPGLNSADGTPTNAPGVTPIDSSNPELAFSPGGASSKHMGGRGVNQNLSAKALTPSSFARHRLPSIGETPTDVMSPTFAAPRRLPTPGDSGSEKEKRSRRESTEEVPQMPPPATKKDSVEYLSPARYKPEDGLPQSGGPQITFPENSSSSKQDAADTLQPVSYSQDQKESFGAERHWSPTVGQVQVNGPTLADSFVSRRDSPASHQGKEPGPSRYPERSNNKSPTSSSVGGRSIDEYISSLDEANYHHSRKQRSHRQDGGSSKRSTSKGQLRGRSKERYIQPAKRSPSSPVPMSPEDLARYSSGTAENAAERPRSRNTSKQRSAAPTSRRSSKARGERGRKKSASRAGSTERAEVDRIESSKRSRSRKKSDQIGVRSPSSPVPMSPSADGPYDRQTDDRDDKLRLVNEERKHRLRSAERSTGRHKERSTSARRDASPDRRRSRERSRVRQQQQQQEQQQEQQDKYPGVTADDRSSHQSPVGKSGGHRRFSQSTGAELLSSGTPNGYPFANMAFSQSSSNVSRKEQAAAELEARRLSLARRPSAPAIPLPGDRPLRSSSRPRNYSEDISPRSNGSFSQRMSSKKPSPPYSSSSDPNSSTRLPCTVPVGLPSTPRAMRHPKYSIGYPDQDVPAVPSLPDTSGMESAENLGASVRRSMSAPVADDNNNEDNGNGGGHADMPNVGGLPAHPQFNRQIPSSKVPDVTLPQRRQGSYSQQGQQQPPPQLNGGKREPQAGEPKGPDDYTVPPLLPELQHLHAPPPPPPPPQAPNAGNSNISPTGEERLSIASGSGVGTINIAIDNGAAEGCDGSNNNNNATIPQRPATTDSVYVPSTSGQQGAVHGNSNGNGNSSSGASRTSMSPDQQQAPHHRRGRSINENLSNRIRSFTDRMRSTSRNRTTAKSPPMDGQEPEMPYESVKMSKQ